MNHTSNNPDKYGNHVAFDENGDGDGKYSIYNYARHPYTGQYDYRLVGDYQGNKLTMRARPIWPGGQSSELPVSQCSEECGFAEVRRLDKKQQCCWSCEPCAENQRVVNLTTCETCPLHYGPSKNRTTCVALEIHYIDIDTWFAIVPMTFSSVGICITIGVIVTWRVYSETPIVRATSRELAYLQLSGCLVSYSAPFVLLATPSVLTCTLQRIMIGLGFAMMYAALLTKTNRIARIFDAAKRTTRRPVYISPRSQLVIAGALITLQLALSAIWFGFDAPDTRIDAPRANQPNYLVRRCAMKDKSFLISLAYNVVLIIVCTAYAIKTRQIPENFNESKFIGFAMYTTCIIWLAFLPMYYATMNNHEIQITTLCISISLSASVMLSCLFIPKLYIIYFHPEKNVRRLTMNNPNAKQKIRELTQQINNASKKNSANFLVETRKDEQKEKHQSATIVTSMTNSSTRTDEQAEKSVSVHTDLDLLPNPSVISGPDKPTQFANVITNPLALVPDAAQQRQSLAKAISNNAPSNKEKQKNPTQMFSLSDIPTPTPLLLDPLSKRVTITPTYCDETTSQDEEDDYIPTRATLSYRNEHVSASIPTMSTQYAAAYSTTNSLSSVETPRSSDLYLQSLGDDTQIAPSVTSYSPSLNGGTIFTQLRQPRRSTSSRIDFTEQKVTAL
ncbi:metabotropic glutamate receptor [Clonorchis sinensis]|uniref:Metabotropic glutamate receptor n=2 Tax=Clonorchis sinensis TaxID=79923 RepID=G7YAE4_CLOSI|nr:metabotropic glutamate receptor [Clonorchis sinensis]